MSDFTTIPGENREADRVIVVGGGPVGLITALGLAQAGVPVLVLDRAVEVNTSPRAMVYLSGVIPGLEKLGLLEDALTIGLKSTDLSFLVYQTGERINFDTTILDGIVPHPYNIHLGQDKLAAIALEHLSRLPDTQVRFGVAVTGLTQDPDGVTLTAESDGSSFELKAGWVIGADGASSTVRHLLGLEFEGTTWPERFVATNIRYDFPSYGFAESNMVIDPKWGAIVAHIDKTGLWRCTFSEDAALPVETVAERIPAFFAEWLPGSKDYELVQYSPYKMHQRAAPTFRSGRVLLAGDAAHVTNPAGALGLTGGLFDSFVLSEALAAVVHGEISDAVLDQYSELRREIFLDYASPVASMVKHMVYHVDDPAELQSGLTLLRDSAADLESSIAQLMVSQPMETPSLITEFAQ